MSRRAPSKQHPPRTGPSRPARPGALPPWIAWLLGATVVAAALLPYGRSLTFQFVWDDPYVIGPHLDVRGPGDLARIWKTPFDVLLKDEGMTRTYFRPVSLYSFAVDRAFGGENPRGFHAQNLLWHALACLFLWLL